MPEQTTDETEPLDRLLDDDDFNVRYLWANEREPFDDERPTASLVVRDKDGEVIAESERFGWSRVWALVAIDIPEDIDDRRRNDDSPELPDWAEWVHCDPPMAHHSCGVACIECGETNEVADSKMPEALERIQPWERINHAAECSLASEQDKEIWAEKQFAADLKDRPAPSVMALDCIWAEIGEWRAADRHGYAITAIENRSAAFESVLERRLKPRYPACPECGGEIKRGGEFDLSCTDCFERIDSETYEDWWDQHRRMWGWRGHGNRGVSDE